MNPKDLGRCTVSVSAASSTRRSCASVGPNCRSAAMQPTVSCSASSCCNPDKAASGCDDRRSDLPDRCPPPLALLALRVHLPFISGSFLCERPNGHIGGRSVSKFSARALVGAARASRRVRRFSLAISASRAARNASVRRRTTALTNGNRERSMRHPPWTHTTTGRSDRRGR